MKKILLIITVLILAFIGYLSFNKDTNISSINLGSIGSDSYLATSTIDASWTTAAAGLGGFKVIKNGPGVVGSVIITNETTGSFTLYDATTTAAHSDHATTTLIKVYPSMAEGTYILDVAFSRGLIAEFQSTSVASSTITYK